jgi:(E)-4-hydroxy-3-methylbut-2-enyl-diphosphate synthase
VSAGFVADPFVPRRRLTRVVKVGDVAIGGGNPIRVQSMTTTDTQDVAATVSQTERLVAAGCEIVRITAPSLRDAEALGEIKRALLARGVGVPLVADIHFTPHAALLAAEHVEKVRVNPGNFADKKRFEVREYSDGQYQEEIERVAARLRPLVRRCKELGRALRIGTNHGSLSDRILNRFGDTPQGMVESALEFLAVCEEEGFRDVVFSMKASNAQVAIQAYRLLAARLDERAPGAPGYPFHVGVTEAGDGEDGRIKSAIGIGALLEDGIGDTIRVSLTEDPVKEIPVAQALAERYDRRWSEPAVRARTLPEPGAPFVADPYSHARRATRAVAIAELGIGGDLPVRVELEVGVPREIEREADALATSLALRPEIACEGVLVDLPDEDSARRFGAYADALAKRNLRAPVSARLAPTLANLIPMAAARAVVRVSPETAQEGLERAAAAAARVPLPLEWALEARGAELASLLDRVLGASQGASRSSRLLFSLADAPAASGACFVHDARLVAARLSARGAGDLPLVLRGGHGHLLRNEALLLATATDLGALLCDGIGDAIALPAALFGDPGRALDLGYRILQGARLRTSWTEFISCPSCGRTLFDLEETTARIKARTQHLRGVKIAIMGCIVNGPGEMADADFGYVGSGPGTVNLYVGKELVERHVPAANADDRLVELIRTHDRWVDPP